MLNSPILDVALSLIFIYLLVALMVTGVTQFIFSLRNTKSVLLKDAINNLFFDSSWTNISEKIINSPSIQMLKKKTDKFPSFIPPKVFANALLDTITVGKPTIEAINVYLEKENGDFANWLKMEVAQCENSVSNLKIQLAGLFDNSMDCVTNWYAREAKWWSRGIALFICAFMNIDSVEIVDYFFANPSAAIQTADAATLFSENNKLDSYYVISGKDTLKTYKLIPTQKSSVKDSSSQSLVVSKKQNDTLSKAKQTPVINNKETFAEKNAPLYNSALITLKERSIPIGWKKYFEKVEKEKSKQVTQKSKSLPDWLNHFLNTSKNVVLKLLGICLSAGAVSLGAPFWFDLLQKLSPLRKKQTQISKAA